MYIEVYNILYLYSNDNSILVVSNLNLLFVGDMVKGKLFKGVIFEDGFYLELYVEFKGYGVCVFYYDGDDYCKYLVDSMLFEFGGNDGIVY